MTKITVLFPIEVPKGKYCWDYSTHETCNHFDNEGGHAKCMLGFDIPYSKDREGVTKSDKCFNLREELSGGD